MLEPDRRLQVHDEPLLRQPQVLPPGAHRLPGDPAGAVAADHGRCRDGAPGAVGLPQPDGRPVDVDPEHRHPAPDGHLGTGLHRAGQEGVEVGLVKVVRPGPAVPADARAGELRPHPVVGPQEPQPSGGAADREEVLRQPGRVQDPDGLVVQVHRPRETPRLRLPLQHRHADAGPGEEQGGQQPHRPGAHDDDGLRHRSSLPGRRPRETGPPCAGAACAIAACTSTGIVTTCSSADGRTSPACSSTWTA